MSIYALVENAALTASPDMLITLGLGVTCAISVFCNFFLSEKLKSMSRYLPLINTFSAAGKGSGKPVGILIDRSGKMISFVCEPNPKNKGLLDRDNYTLINPDLVKPSARSRFPGSPEILFYPMPGFLPVGFHESAALVQTAKKIRENDLLNWLPSELNVLVLLFDGNSDLLEDCKTMVTDAIKVKSSIPALFLDESFDDIDDFENINDEQLETIAKHLMNTILDFRRELAITPVRCEPVYLNEAADLCTVGITGNSVASLLSLQEQGDRAERLDFFDKHKDLIIIVAGIVAIPLLYYMVMKFV